MSIAQVKYVAWFFAVIGCAAIGLFLWIGAIDKKDRQDIAKNLELAQEQVASSQTLPEDAETKPTGSEKELIQATEIPFNVSVVYSKDYLVNLGGAEGFHPFDIRKYEKIHQELVKHDLLADELTFRPGEISAADLLLVHSAEYLESLQNRSKVATYLEAPALNLLPISLDQGILKPFRFTTAGTLLAARQALQHGIGVNIGGGYHHAKIETGDGFCIYADVPIAIRKLQQEKRIQRAVVIDVDVHQGNGTIVCLADDDSTYTFSMHQGEIYPIPKEIGDRDVELAAGMQDEEYLQILNRELTTVLDEAKADICFLVAGCDTLAGDPLAELQMTHEGVVDRDMAIVQACVDRKIPVVYTTSGGYSKDAWKAQYLSIRNIIETFSLAEDKQE